MSLVSFPFLEDWATRVLMKSSITLPTAEILSGKNALSQWFYTLKNK